MNMKLLLIFFLSILAFFSELRAQCSPNSLFTSIGLPGVFPPSVQIPGLSNFGLNNGFVGNTYSETLTLVILEDTIMDVSSILPPSIVSTMNSANIPTVMTLNVNHATFDVQGLPIGLSYECDVMSCHYLSGTDGCIELNGIPNIAGVFSLDINVTLNIQVPSITDPIFGTVIFPSTSFDLPQFPVQNYEISVFDITKISEQDNILRIFPNPTSDIVNILLDDFVDIVVYNALGKELLVLNRVYGNLVLNKDDLGCGVFFVNVSSEYNNTVIKLIIR